MARDPGSTVGRPATSQWAWEPYGRHLTRNRGKLCTSNSQPPIQGGDWERQPTELRVPRSRSAGFSTRYFLGIHSQAHPRSAYPLLTPPAQCLPPDIQEMEEKLWAMVQLSTTVVLGARQRQIPAPPQPCVPIPQTPGPTIWDCAPTLYFLDVSRRRKNYWVSQLQTFKYHTLGAGEMAQVFKGRHCSSRGPKFRYQYPHQADHNHLQLQLQSI